MILDNYGLEATNAKSVKQGEKYGRLTVKLVGQRPNTYKYYAVCVCDCGNKKLVRFDSLKKGTTSCGCLQKEKTKTHGRTKHPLYICWKHMLRRCYNKLDKSYPNYGGRGISVCKRWHDIENFIADMGPHCSDDVTIERIDNNGDYTPGNCIWANRKVQANNRRTTHFLTYNGKTQSLKAWSEELGLNLGTLWERIKVWGWDIERALTQPPANKEENMRQAQKLRWAGHTKKAKPQPRVFRKIVIDGEEMKLSEAAKITGIPAKKIGKRIFEYGWSVERAVADRTD